MKLRLAQSKQTVRVKIGIQIFSSPVEDALQNITRTRLTNGAIDLSFIFWEHF